MTDDFLAIIFPVRWVTKKLISRFPIMFFYESGINHCNIKQTHLESWQWQKETGQNPCDTKYEAEFWNC